MRAKEFQPNKLVIFDIDDTLVHTQTKVHVVQDGEVTKELNSHEFTLYKLQPGEKFDFENFRNAQDFFNNSKPIIPMMNQLKNDIATGNKVVMVTARADFDDRELFLDTFRKYGVDMSRVHVYRAGNMTGKMQTEEKKKIIIRKLLDKGNYTKAIMYDDAIPNLESFVELKDEYSNTKFYAWHVSLEGEASEFHRTNESLNEVKFGGQEVEGNSLSQLKEKFPNLSTVLYFIPGLGQALVVADVASQIQMYNQAIDKIEKQYPTQTIQTVQQKVGDTGEAWETLDENFADGRNPQDKGDSKRYHVPTKASVTTLRKVAKQGGRKGQLAHWMANMKAGKTK